MSDAELRLKQLMLTGLDGSATAQRDLLRELARLLRAFFARRLGSGAAAVEDLVQETLIAVHQRRASYDTGQAFLPWAFAIARYRMIDQIRRSKVRAAQPLDDAEQHAATETADATMAARDLETILAALPEKQRKLLVDVKVSGLSIEEAAAAHGMGASAVKVTLHRTMKRLGSLFAGGRDAD